MFTVFGILQFSLKLEEIRRPENSGKKDNKNDTGTKEKKVKKWRAKWLEHVWRAGPG